MATLTKRHWTNKSGKNWCWEIRYEDLKTGKPLTKSFDKSISKKKMNLIKSKIETELAERKLSKDFTFLKKDKKIMVSEWFQTYIKNLPADISLATVKRYDIALRKFIEAVGDMLIESVDIDIIEEWRRTRIKSNGLSPSGVNVEHRILRACFNIAVKSPSININSNPFLDVNLYKTVKKLPRIVPDEDINTFFTFMKKLSETPYGENKLQNNRIKKAKMDYAFLLQLYYTGMRPNEPLKFRWENIRGNIATIPTTKEKKERYKYIHPEVFKLLEPKESGKVFEYIKTVRTIDKRFHKYIIAAGLPENYTPYYFRHSFITNALKRGMSTKMVSEAVGHADTKVTEAHYAHLKFSDTISVFKNTSIPQNSENITKNDIENFLSTKQST